MAPATSSTSSPTLHHAPPRGITAATFPHIMDLIARWAGYAALLSLRGASTAMRDLADRHLARHVVLQARGYTHASGARLPFLRGAGAGATAWRAHVRILDVGNGGGRNEWFAPGATAYLSSLLRGLTHLGVVRLHHALSLPPFIPLNAATLVVLPTACSPTRPKRHRRDTALNAQAIAPGEELANPPNAAVPSPNPRLVPLLPAGVAKVVVHVPAKPAPFEAHYLHAAGDVVLVSDQQGARRPDAQPQPTPGIFVEPLVFPASAAERLAPLLDSFAEHAAAYFTEHGTPPRLTIVDPPAVDHLYAAPDSVPVPLVERRTHIRAYLDTALHATIPDYNVAEGVLAATRVLALGDYLARDGNRVETRRRPCHCV